MKSNVALGVLVVLSAALVANAAARLVGYALDSAALTQTEVARARWVDSVQAGPIKPSVVRIASLLAAAIEGALASMAILNVWRRFAAWSMVALLCIFSVLLVVGGLSGWPVGACQCFGANLQLRLGVHLVVNGALVGLLGWSASQLHRMRPERVHAS